jgi:putative Mg2+ transporter-C (MgtC) family protein
VGLLPELTLFGRIVLAAVLGYAIGYERELRGKPAGERTFALVALGSAAVTGLGVEAFPTSAEKVIAGVITGVGFLGAGLIIRESGAGMVRGLTTAASSWAAAAIGILSGAGVYFVAALTTLLVLLILEANRLPLVRAIEPGKLGHPDPGRDERDDLGGGG